MSQSVGLSVVVVQVSESDGTSQVTCQLCSGDGLHEGNPGRTSMWYATLRDAILTCAQKLTGVSLICCMETTAKKWKTEKLKKSPDMLGSNSKQSGESCSQS